MIKIYMLLNFSIQCTRKDTCPSTLPCLHPGRHKGPSRPLYLEWVMESNDLMPIRTDSRLARQGWGRHTMPWTTCHIFFSTEPSSHLGQTTFPPTYCTVTFLQLLIVNLFLFCLFQTLNTGTICATCSILKVNISSIRYIYVTSPVSCFPSLVAGLITTHIWWQVLTYVMG